MNDSIRTTFPCGLRGFHVYQDIWKPVIGETLHCIHERNNDHDRYAIAATKRLYLIQLWGIYQERFPGTRVFLFQEEETLK